MPANENCAVSSAVADDRTATRRHSVSSLRQRVVRVLERPTQRLRHDTGEDQLPEGAGTALECRRVVGVDALQFRGDKWPKCVRLAELVICLDGQNESGRDGQARCGKFTEVRALAPERGHITASGAHERYDHARGAGAGIGGRAPSGRRGCQGCGHEYYSGACDEPESLTFPDLACGTARTAVAVTGRSLGHTTSVPKPPTESLMDARTRTHFKSLLLADRRRIARALDRIAVAASASVAERPVVRLSEDPDAGVAGGSPDDDAAVTAREAAELADIDAALGLLRESPASYGHV